MSATSHPEAANRPPYPTAWLSLAAVVVAVIWGLCFLLIQSSLDETTPFFAAGMRSLLGAITLGAWIAFSKPPAGSVPPLRRLPRFHDLAFLALMNSALALGAMYLAAGRATAGVASLLAGGQPLVLAVAGRVIFGDRIGKTAGTGLALGLGGVTLVATTAGGATTGMGVALALVASLAPAAGTVWMRRLADGVDLIATTATQFLIGGVILIMVGQSIEDPTGTRWSVGLVLSLVILGVVGTGFAYVVWFSLVKYLGLVVLGGALLLVPVVGVVASSLTGERPTMSVFIGALVTLIGMGLITWRPIRPNPVPIGGE